MARKNENQEPEVEQTEAAPAEKTTKSIVPGKYAGKYKTSQDELSTFINEQCTGKDGFQWPAFFELMRKNVGGSLTEDKIAHYEGQVTEKRHGAQGRARMTLRNMLATNVRKNGTAVGLDNETREISLPKPALSGAAAKAAENAGTDGATA